MIKMPMTINTNKPKVSILVVDDRPENLIAIECILERLDVEIVRATSGRQALSELLRYDFAVVLLDVQMPEIDGFEIASLMKKNRKTNSIPIIFVTAINTEQRYVFKGYESGAVDYLFKPLDPEILLGKVRVFLDLFTQRKELERAYEELERRNKELNDFATVAAHDLRSPLDKVVAFSERLEKYLPAELRSEKIQMYLDAISRSASQMGNFVESLLEYARAGTEDKMSDKIDLASPVEKALENLRIEIEDSGTSVEVGPMPIIRGNFWALVQLFQNLINNAIKFRGDEPLQIKVAAQQGNGEICITIADNGIGIAPENHEKIFAAFNRLHARDKYQGSGIGLATCKKVVAQHHGRIWVEAELGNGSMFHIALPCSDVVNSPAITVSDASFASTMQPT